MAFSEEKEAWKQKKSKKGGDSVRLIDADALRKNVLDLPNCYNGFSDAYDKACIIGVIDEQPTIEERKTGKWTSEEACEFCGFQPWYENDIHTLSFCPNCGADMRGGQDG